LTSKLIKLTTIKVMTELADMNN